MWLLTGGRVHPALGDGAWTVVLLGTGSRAGLQVAALQGQCDVGSYGLGMLGWAIIFSLKDKSFCAFPDSGAGSLPNEPYWCQRASGSGLVLGCFLSPGAEDKASRCGMAAGAPPCFSWWAESLNFSSLEVSCPVIKAFSYFCFAFPFWGHVYPEKNKWESSQDQF